MSRPAKRPAARPATVPPSSAVRSRRRLSDQPLIHTLIDGFDRAVNGSITFVDPSGIDHTLRLVHGVPAGAETRRDVAPLGAILRDMGLSEAETLEVRLASGSRYDMLTARALAIRGKLADQVLRDALHVQLLERVRMMLALPGDTLYACHADANLLSSFHPREPIACSDADFVELITEGVRSKRLELPVAHTLRLLKDVPLELSEDAPLGLLHFTEDENAVLEVLIDKALTARELVARALAAPGVVGIVVYVLVVLRFIQIPGEDRPPVGSRRRSRSGVVRRG